MRTEINIPSWYRKDQFEFFSKFDEPFFGVTVRIDCTKAYAAAKNQERSFFLQYLHASLVAANTVTPFKYRMVDGKVYEYEVVNASPTINRDNGSFGFSYIEFYPDLQEFIEKAQPVIEKVRASEGLEPAVMGENVIHYSSLPWIDFTSLSHARHFPFADSCPKISFGKMTSSDNNLSMPVSIHVHHALMDGFHVGQYIEEFQKAMDATS